VVCPALGQESEGAVREGGVKEEWNLVLGLWEEVSKKIEERLPCAACEGIWECRVAGGGQQG